MLQTRFNNIKGVRWIAVAALGATVQADTPAWATITTWTYTTTSQFDTGATVFADGSCTDNTTNTPTKLAWGCSAQSSLVISPATASATVNTWTGGGTPPAAYISDPGIILTHNNFTISSGSHNLLNAELDNTINITSPNTIGPISVTFGIQFTETTNDPGSGNCAVGNEPCPDIFVFTNSGLNTTINGGDGQTYKLSLFPATSGAFESLSDDACEAAGAAPGCFGFVTKEGQANDLHFGLSISTQPIGVNVPEPGALGMMGLGLLGIVGLALVSRRRKAEDIVD